jgi:hypothetical protein
MSRNLRLAVGQVSFMPSEHYPGGQRHVIAVAVRCFGHRRYEAVGCADVIHLAQIVLQGLHSLLQRGDLPRLHSGFEVIHSMAAGDGRRTPSSVQGSLECGSRWQAVMEKARLRRGDERAVGADVAGLLVFAR